MSNPATIGDLESRWRPLSAQEAINGAVFIDDAWRMLQRRIADIADNAADDDDLFAEVARVIATAVLRVMKNPDGKTQESIDDYSWMRDQSVSSGVLYFTDDELDSLTTAPVTRGGAFSFSLLPADYPDSRFTAGE